MPDSENAFIEARRVRTAMRRVFEAQRGLIKADLDTAGVGRRVAGRLVEDGRYLAGQAAENAGAHKTVVAAAALGLVGWFLRGPLIAFAASVTAKETNRGAIDANTRFAGDRSHD